MSVGRIGRDHDLRVDNLFAILIWRSSRVDIVIVKELLRVDGLLVVEREIGGVLHVLRRILAVVGWWVAHRPRTQKMLIYPLRSANPDCK